MYNPQKLHPVAYAGSVVKGIKTMFFPAIIIFFNMREELFSGSINPLMLFGGIGILALIFIVFTGFDMLNIYRTRFWIENNKFVFKNGIFTRNEKELDIKRIQSIDFNQPFFHRIFGAVQLDILTPGDGIKIDTIKKSQGEDIQKVIYETQQDIESEETGVNIGDASVWPKEQNTEIAPKTAVREFATLKKMNFKELILMAMTSGGLGVFAAIFFGVLNVVGGEILIENYFEYVSGIVRSLIFSIVIASMVFVIIGYVIGTVIIMVRNYDYTLKQSGDDLTVEYGLFSKKNKSVNINRVQNVIISDSILRRLIGYYALSVSITSDSLESDAIDGKVQLLPFIKKKELYSILGDIFPNYHLDLPKRIVPFRAIRRYFQLTLLFFIIGISVMAYFFHGETFMLYFYIGAAVILLLLIASGIYSARNVGYAIYKDEINMMTASFFTRRHYAIKRDKIIDTTYRRNPFLHRADLGHIEVSTPGGIASSSAEIKFIEKHDIETIWAFIERGHDDETHLAESDQTMED